MCLPAHIRALSFGAVMFIIVGPVYNVFRSNLIDKGDTNFAVVYTDARNVTNTGDPTDSFQDNWCNWPSDPMSNDGIANGILIELNAPSLDPQKSTVVVQVME